MTTTNRLYRGAADAAELNRTHRCRRAWCDTTCYWDTDPDGTIGRTHRQDLGDGFVLAEAEPAPDGITGTVGPVIFIPQPEAGGSLSADQAAAYASALKHAVALIDRDTRNRTGR